MYVKRLALAHYRGFKDVDFSFSPGINIIFGENGAGKSATLEAVSMMLSWYVARLRSPRGAGKPFQEHQVFTQSSEARVEIDVIMESERRVSARLVKVQAGYENKSESDLSQVSEWAREIREKRNDNECVRYPLMVFYGVNRAVLDIPLRIRTRPPLEPLDGYNKAFDGTCDFRSFFGWFREREDLENEIRTGKYDYRDSALESVRLALSKFVPELNNIKIRRQHLAMLAEKDGVKLNISQLSDGEKCLFALIGDIARRLAMLNMGGNKENCTISVDEILQSEGIVLVDELDLHLHPLWQRRVIEQLPKVFPHVQFIVSTHSPDMISEVNAGCIFAVSSHGVRRPDMGRGFSSAEVLEHTMGAPLWPKEIDEQIKKVDVSIDDEDWEKAKQEIEKLKMILPEGAPILSKLNTEIDLLS